MNNALKNITIEKSDFTDFREKETFKINHIENNLLQKIILKPLSERRYWRILPDMSKEKPQLAEIYFYDRDNNLIPDLLEHVISPDKSDVSNIFDNMPLTFSEIKSPIILNMSKLPEIYKIEIMPRNDDNYVVPGNLYELLYREKDGWISLGKKMSTDYSLDYNNVPSGALYWLKNHTKGIEERIFTIENNKQVFW